MIVIFIQCVKLVGDKLREYGVKNVYVACGNRVPLVKMKLNFLNTPAIDFDIVVAAVLDKDSTTLDVESLYQKSTHKSKSALEVTSSFVYGASGFYCIEIRPILFWLIRHLVSGQHPYHHSPRKKLFWM